MLTCAACGTDNPAGFRFCGGCAAALQAVCPTCGASAPPGFRFCGSCGGALDTVTPIGAALPARSAAPAAAASPEVIERRVCSVLFADLVGFTPLSEARDPEEVRELLSRYFATARTVITRYGGVVEKFIGDAVMAVWGTPVAAEGDAERAVRAGLELVAAVAALGSDVGAAGLVLRAGVVTGEVAASVGAVGEGMVAGDAVNTAARVQSAAEPGTVWVDSPTQRLAGAGVGFRNTGTHALKGKAAPVELWQATRVLASVGGAQRVDGLEAPMIGRDAEDRTLRELFHACVARRTPRVVTITGAAGAGKSRLAWEFEKYVDGLADAVNWHRGRCLSYGDGAAFWALAEAIRQRFDIASEDPVTEATVKFLAGLDRWVPSVEERSFIGVRLGRLLGLTHPDDAGVALGQDELFTGWRVFLERMADSEPVVLLIEDAHHTDDALLDFVEHVLDWARQSPIFFVLLGRLELIEARPGLAGGRNRTCLTLDPLDDRSMRALVDALVHGMPDPAVTAIAEQAQGNPLFAVETVRALVDRDVIRPLGGEYRLVADIGPLSVPDSLHGLLAARLDALDPPLRVLVADAAVLGTSFPVEALAAVSGRSVAELVTVLAELVRRGVFDVSTDPLSPERGSYVFAQSMLRQVAYDTLSRRDRRTRHLAVAEHLQTAFAGGGDEIMDVIARHYLDALDAVGDDTDPDIRAKALTSLIRAAERSERAGAQFRAAVSFDRAAQLVLTQSETEAARLWERSAAAYAAASHFGPAEAAVGRARAAYLVHGLHRDAARSLATTGAMLSQAGRLAEARAVFDEALAELRPDPDSDTVVALGRAAMTAALGGDPHARALADEALGLGQALDVSSAQMADLFTASGVAAFMTHRRTEAITAMSFAAQLAERAGHRVGQARAQVNLSAFSISSDFKAAATAARAACESARLSGARSTLDVAIANLGMAQLCSGDWDQALIDLDEVRGDDNDDLDLPCLVRVVLLALRGDIDRAVELKALPRLRLSEDVQDRASIVWVDAVVEAEGGRIEQALARLRELFADDDDLDLDTEGIFLSWPLAVQCAFDLDDLTEVRRLVAVLDARPIGHLPPILRGTRAIARARLVATDSVAGDLDAVDAVDGSFADAIIELRAVGSPHHLAYGLLDHAAYLLEHGRDVVDQLEEARAIGERLQAVGITRRVQALQLAVSNTA